MKIRKMFESRYHWMGIAMLWIVFYHAKIPCQGVLYSLKSFGYGGVDMFLLASGVGNYYSYLREEQPLVFFRRRLKRLAPTYLPLICVWLAYCLWLGILDGRMAVGNLLGISGFSFLGSSFNWYISAILFLYLLTPYLATFVKESSLKGNLMLLGVLVVSSVAFWNNTTLIVMVTRIPVFFVGMMLANYSEKVVDLKLSAATVLLAFLGAAALHVLTSRYEDYLWSHGLYWYPFICIAPCLCMLISFAVQGIHQHRLLSIPFTPVLRLTEMIGRSSFEIYMIHIILLQIGDDIRKQLGLPMAASHILLVLLSLVLGVLMHRLVSRLTPSGIARKGA